MEVGIEQVSMPKTTATVAQVERLRHHCRRVRDDLFLPEKLERQLEALRAAPRAGNIPALPSSDRAGD